MSPLEQTLNIVLSSVLFAETRCFISFISKHPGTRLQSLKWKVLNGSLASTLRSLAVCFGIRACKIPSMQRLGKAK